MKWYQQAARSIDALARCEKSNNEYGVSIHENTIFELNAMLPHGSGIDGRTAIDLNKSTTNRIVVYGEYHIMSDGYYTHWIEYTVTIKPDLISEFELSIVGNFGRDQDIKEYLYQVYSDAFLQEFETASVVSQ